MPSTTVRTSEVNRFVLPAGQVLKITANATSSGRYGRLGNQDGDTPSNFPTSYTAIAANKVVELGPFPYQTRFIVESLVGALTVTTDTAAAGYEMALDAVRLFTGSFSLALEDNGRVFRCEDGSNVTITVPNSLPEGFICGFAMWGGGTVTLQAGSGATKRSSTSALGTQYKTGSLRVVKNADGATAEFALSGDFA
jgi:hypothetical protein